MASRINSMDENRFTNQNVPERAKVKNGLVHVQSSFSRPKKEGISLILVLSLRPRLPLLGECGGKGGWGGCFVCGVKRHAVCVLCFSDSSVFSLL